MNYPSQAASAPLAQTIAHPTKVEDASRLTQVARRIHSNNTTVDDILSRLLQISRRVNNSAPTPEAPSEPTPDVYGSVDDVSRALGILEDRLAAVQNVIDTISNL